MKYKVRKTKPQKPKGKPDLKTVADQAYRALKMSTKLATIATPEKKYCDVYNVFTPTLTGSIVQLSPIAQGVDYNERVGLATKALSIQYKIWGEGVINQTSRMIFFVDKESTGSPPAVIDVLETTSVVSFIYHPNNDRFLILKDMFWHHSVAGDSCTSVTGYHKLDHHIRFLNPLSSGLDEGQVYCLFITDTTAAGAASFAVNSRIRYVDA